MGIKENIEARKSADALVDKFAALVKEEYALLSPHGQRCFCQALHDRMAMNLKINCYVAMPETAVSSPTHKSRPAEASNELGIDEAIEQIEKIIDDCDSVPSAGEEFADSVRETASSMRDVIVESEVVTKNQTRAIGNWARALAKWIDNDQY